MNRFKMTEIKQQLPLPPLPDYNEEGIFLGYPFDQLLRRDCPLEPRINPIDTTKGERYKCGILLPTDNSPGTGNIVICGRPGSGKSTLAMQIAVACVTHEWNKKWDKDKKKYTNKSNIASAYISLEEDVDRVKVKAKSFGWEKYFHKISQLHDSGIAASTDNLANILKSILTQPRNNDQKSNCPFHGGDYQNNKQFRKWANGEKCSRNHHNSVENAETCVLLPSLSPRPISKNVESAQFYTERYLQLERLLSAAWKLQEDKNGFPSLRLVCIDSLNMFGLNPLTREEHYRLFDLFRRYKMIGVFVVETSQETPFDSTMADVTINLYSEEDRSYVVRYLEIDKSRFVHQVYGKHLFKTISFPESKTMAIPKEIDNRTGLVVYPSLHYLSNRVGNSRT